MSRIKFLMTVVSILVLTACTNTKEKEEEGIIGEKMEISTWTTTADAKVLLKKQSQELHFLEQEEALPKVEIFPKEQLQIIDGFGYTLTGGSAQLIRQMDVEARARILNEIFGCGEDGNCTSFLRLSMGASDLDESVFSYTDTKNNEPDPELNGFTLAKDTINLIPLLKEILAINPDIKLMATPWSAPSWMKNNKNSKGGSLLQKYEATYASYFVKYHQAMAEQGINIHYFTIQNEPHHGGNNPSMVMEADQQARFIAQHLGPAFAEHQIPAKIIIWDHNCDEAAYPIEVLKDEKARPYIDGSAFHLYAGDISALSEVHQAFPEKNLYFTEQWTGAKGDFGGDLLWHIKNVVIGSLRNWSKIALEWNLANDPGFGPHTPGGCTECKGAMTIDGNNYEKNVSFYIIGHIAKFVPPGSRVIKSLIPEGLSGVALQTPGDQMVLLLMNETDETKSFSIAFNGKNAKTEILPKAVVTYVWQ